MEVTEEDLIEFCANKALEGGQVDPAKFVASIPPDLHQSVTKVLVDLLKEETSADTVEILESGQEVLVSHRTDRAGQTTSMTFFRIKDAALQAALPLMGLSIAVSTKIGLLPAVVPSFQTARALWNGYKRLYRPRHGDAIRVVEIILHHQVGARQWNWPPHPTVKQIEERADLPVEKTRAALSFLLTEGLVEVAELASQESDKTHPNNTIRMRM